MAICTNCGNKVPDDIKFCVSCGAALAAEGTEQLAPQLQPVSQPQSVQHIWFRPNSLLFNNLRLSTRKSLSRQAVILAFFCC